MVSFIFGYYHNFGGEGDNDRNKTSIIMKCITFFKLFSERILNRAAILASPASFSVLVSSTSLCIWYGLWYALDFVPYHIPY